MTTKTRIVRIGNSRGIRVPKLLLDRADLPEEVELRAEPGRLVVSAPARPRAGWAAKAKAMHQHGDDVPLDAATATNRDNESMRLRPIASGRARCFRPGRPAFTGPANRARPASCADSPAASP